MLEWGGAHALPRDENSLHEERARWHPTLLCVLSHFVRGDPPFGALFPRNQTCFCTLFFLAFAILDPSGRGLSVRNPGQICSTSTDLQNAPSMKTWRQTRWSLWRF